VLKIAIHVLMLRLVLAVRLNISLTLLLLITLLDQLLIVQLAHQIVLNALLPIKMEKKIALLVQRLRIII